MTPIELFLIGIMIMMIGGAVLFFMTRKTYKNDVDIARQTGAHPTDVIWIHDKFRVINKDGAWVIQFAKLREKTRSVDGKLWTKFLKPSSEGRLLKMTKEEWDSNDMSTHIKRGLKLYETTEGEFFPMSIEQKDGKFTFSILDQDNRQFVIDEIKNINDLTRNKKQEVMLLWGIIVGFIVLAIAFMTFMYFMNKAYQSNLAGMANICGTIYQQVINGPSPVNNSVHPAYLSTLTKTLGG